MKILVHLSYQVRYLIAAVGAGFLLASATLAQSTFGSITGVVTDGSGGVTPGAEVSVTNSGTGAARKLTTGATGVFNVPNLDLGTYVLRVSAKGFSTYERTGLNLESNELLVMSVEVATTPTFRAGTPKLLFKLPGPLGGNLGNISRDGQRFVFAINVPAANSAR